VDQGGVTPGSRGARAEKLLSSWPPLATTHLCFAAVERLEHQRLSSDSRCDTWYAPWAPRELSLQRSCSRHPAPLQ
jgi:hypothetical protein